MLSELRLRCFGDHADAWSRTADGQDERHRLELTESKQHGLWAVEAVGEGREVLDWLRQFVRQLDTDSNAYALKLFVHRREESLPLARNTSPHPADRSDAIGTDGNG